MFGKKKGLAAGEDQMKLDFKRTLFVGFAFMGIMCFWEVYDYIMPLILQRIFGMSYTEYGVIMALDNMLAIFLLPLFGHLSDKRNSKMGRRTTFILWGTILAVAFMICMAVVEHVEYGLVTQIDMDDPNAVYDYVVQYGSNWTGDEKASMDAFVAGWQNADIQTWFNGLKDGTIELTSDQNAIYNSDFLTPFYETQRLIAAQVRGENVGLLVAFIIMLLAVLFFIRNEFAQLFEIFSLKLLLAVMAIVLASGLLICMVSTYFVVNKLISLNKDDLYY